MFKVTYAVKENVIKSGSLNTNPSHSAWLARFADCELIEVETENNLFLAQDNLIYSGGQIVIDEAKLAERAEAQKQQDLKQLEALAFAQQNKIIDQNMGQFLWDMFKRFDLSVCPIAKNYKDFLDALWLQYHTDKASLNFDVDYSTIVPANEYSYQEIEAEYISNK